MNLNVCPNLIETNRKQTKIRLNQLRSIKFIKIEPTHFLFCMLWNPDKLITQINRIDFMSLAGLSNFDLHPLVWPTSQPCTISNVGSICQNYGDMMIVGSSGCLTKLVEMCASCDPDNHEYEGIFFWCWHELFGKKWLNFRGDKFFCWQFQVIYMTGWKEHHSQQKAKRRGSATISLDDIKDQFGKDNWVWSPCLVKLGHFNLQS